MNKIINILKKKPLPLDKFINISLYNKNFGYYMKKNPFGESGDYITSPLISNLFGEMITIWCVAFWENLGKPNKIIIVEMGPGDGSLCKDILTTSKNFKNFYECLTIKLYEKSDKLKNIQKKKIKNSKIEWIDSLSKLKNGPIIFLGNEFFDSLPIKQFHKKKKKIYEKYVFFSKKEKKIKFLFKKTNKNLIKKIKKLNLFSGDGIIEYPFSSIKYLKIISKKIIKYNGGLLVFDYGYTKKKSENTLKSLFRHKHVDTFFNPGHADITSHINYELFSNILIKENLKVQKVVTQSEFLQKLGIIERANLLSKKMSFKTKADIFYRLKRLLHYKMMGDLFKVLFAKKKGNKFSLGF